MKLWTLKHGERHLNESSIELSPDHAVNEGLHVWSVSHFLNRAHGDLSQDGGIQRTREWLMVRKFFLGVLRLLTMQLSFITTSLALFSFALTNSERHEMETDSCSHKFHLSCLDLGINLVLFLILLPLVFKVGILPFWNKVLFVIWTLALGLDISLLLSNFAFKGKAVFCFALVTVSVSSIWAQLYILPDRYVTWTWASFVGSSVCLIIGTLSQIWLDNQDFWWGVLAAIILVNGILIELRFVCNHVSPKEYVLATLFLMFPEGLACLSARGEHKDSFDEVATPMLLATQDVASEA